MQKLAAIRAVESLSNIASHFQVLDLVGANRHNIAVIQDNICGHQYGIREQPRISGDPFGAPNEIPLGRIVQPGETVDISIPMKAPANVGDYRTDWVLSNETRSNFKDPVFLKITVIIPPKFTATPTKTP